MPIDAVLKEVVSAMDGTGSCVLIAEPGAGKTTRVPPSLVREGGAVWVLEPRRLAARAAARRVAEEQGWTAGDEVGWAVRFERRFNRQSRVVFCTEGVLLRRLQEDPFLTGIATIVMDEFHERHLEGDLVLALARRIQREVRKDLRLLVMSATLAAEPVAEFLGAKIVRSEGRLFPVETRHEPARQGERIDQHLVRLVPALARAEEGDLLVFLPGVSEIEKARHSLGNWAERAGVEILPLHGSLPPAEQDRALERGLTRRVILATNVAESSVTVPGVRIVIDSGQARVLRHDPSTLLDKLVLERISVASADQRAGRAGRLAPGLAVRLWSALDHRTLRREEEPEVRRLDLTGPVLQLLDFGEPDPRAFPWFEAPRPEALERAEELLQRLGALFNGALTPLGRELARLPLHPRLARLLLEGWQQGVPHSAALTAALLSERDPFDAETDGLLDAAESDLDPRLDALLCLERSGSATCGLRPGPGRQVLRARDQLLRLLQRGESPAPSADKDLGLTRALLAAWPDRLAVRREPGGSRLRGIDGKGLVQARESRVTEAELLLALVVQGGRGEPLVKIAVGVPRELVNGGLEHAELKLCFDPGERRVRAVRRRMLGLLQLGEEQVAIPADRAAEAESLLAKEVAHAPELLFGADEEFVQLRARLACAAAWDPSAGIPAVDEAGLATMLPSLVAGCRSFDDIRRKNVAEILLASLPHGTRIALERLAPEHISVQSGSRIKLHYEVGRPPVLAVRIQELFGLARTPSVGGGRVPCLLHLLAPNYRPQQITDDLAGFWERTWPTVRKELRTRYPRHSWPEDPLAAAPERRPRRRQG